MNLKCIICGNLDADRTYLLTSGWFRELGIADIGSVAVCESCSNKFGPGQKLATKIVKTISGRKVKQHKHGR